MNKFEALKFDDSNNGDSTDDKEDDEFEPRNMKTRSDESINGEGISEEEERRIKLQAELENKIVTVGDGEHPLQCPHAFWFSRRAPGKLQSSANYADNIKLVGKFASVEQFWRFYSYLVRPGDLSGHSDIHLFKDGIKPMWEDEANKYGGKWIVRLRKGLASRCWENLILAMLGEQFMVGSEVCGAVISVRFQEDIISIWNRNAADQATTTRIRDTLKRVLNLPQNTIMEYKAHQSSLKDNSSFRNTDVFMR
ncbi:eukaryotic translation initiation factor 4E type 2-like [Pocillopora verrucosa]|uniref:eukaryotic translation initiation factor 4E type 2-like n=1 Tax=Pocillopora verrucosa TaxID=203993 RepID=UPI0027973C90|nr:eukaryotic translation initiation factor 4E type 2-like [Pocillopora verrucosa]